MGTLFDALLNLAEKLPVSGHGTASGGSVTTLVDSVRSERDDFWNGGTVFIISGDSSSVTRRITDFVQSTGTISFSTLDSAVAAGDEYALLNVAYNRECLVSAVNAALREIGPLPAFAIVSPSEEDQESYLLNGISNIVQVETTQNDEEPYDWKIHYYWREINNRLIFDSGKNQFTKLRISYMAPNSYVSDDADVVSDYVHDERLAWTALYYVLFRRMGVAQNNEPYLDEWLAEAKEQKMILANRYPLPAIQPTPRLASY